MSLIDRLTRRPANLSCQELVEVVTDYLEGALSARDTARFERHLADCPHCTAYVQQLGVTLSELGELSEDDLDTPVGGELLRVFADWKASEED
jgi:anti-sigma factor RsiW